MVTHELQVQGFEGRRLALRWASLLGMTVTLFDGDQPVGCRKGWRSGNMRLRRNDGREVEATIHRSIFIPVTAVTIDGERIEVPHLHDAAAFLLSLPLFLMIAFGGLLGVGIGAPAALCFDAIIRGTSNSARKAGLLLVLVIAACLVYGVAAAVFVNVVLPPLALRW